MKRIITRLYDKKIDASGLAVFRVFYGIVLLCEIVQLFYFRHLIFDKIPYLEVSEIDYTVPLLVWMITVIFIIFGLFARTATIINYLFSLIFLSTIITYEYHMFYVYLAVNFLLMFVSVSKVASLDSLRLQLRYSNTRITYSPPRLTSVLNYYSIILLGIVFLYFDSIFQKFATNIWLSGLGMWLPISMPQTTLLNSETFVQNSKILSLFLGYLTLIFELSFLFLFFRKKWRIPLLIIGVGLHMGILIVFPIPWFALGFSSLYLLMVPVLFWNKLNQRLRFKKPRLTFYYDEECPLCNRTKIIINYLDFFNAIEFKGVQTYGFNNPIFKDINQEDLLDNIYSISNNGIIYSGIDTYKIAFRKILLLFPLGILLSIPGIYHIGKWVYGKVAQNRYVERCTEENCGFIPMPFPVNNEGIKLLKNLRVKDLKIYAISLCFVAFSLFQINCIYNSLLIKKIKNEIGFSDTIMENSIQKFSKPLQKISKVFFGITQHGVFVDSHFNNYRHIIAIKAELKNGELLRLPIINENGSPYGYNYSFIWAKWTFRVNNPNINQSNLERGVRDFTAFWAHKNKIDLNTTKFLIKVKKVDIPTQWEENFLSKQIAKPWIDGGYVEWKEDKFYGFIKDIESL